MSSKHIHLVFKTHLDVGFTDHAEKVRRQYHERFIPQAIETGEHFFREDPDRPRFIWTTGAWLIADHLENAGKAEVMRLEQAIARGLIRWHALPFTTHSELMSPALFRAGLSYAAELDRRFGRATLAAKMTDVPGHTRGIVPLLAEAGVRFLHLGVNTASPVPDLPDVFRWRAPGGEEIVVMYQNSYGGTHFPEGFSDGLSFAHTNDNVGPQSVSQTAEAYRHLQAEYPDATIGAATLDDFGRLLWEKREQFPVVELEIGDSWIHGIGSDPAKVGRFLALQRLYDSFAEDRLTPQRQAFGRGLAMVPEHTWGVDIKTFLRDETAWDRPDFDAARAGDFRFTYTEASWAEQRAYLDSAVAELGTADRAAAAAAVAPLVADPAVGAVSSARSLDLAGWTITIDRTTGDVARVSTPAGHVLEGTAGSLFGYRHESYDHDDMARQLDSYILHREDWAILDHDKPGLQHARTAKSGSWAPELVEILASENQLAARMTLPEVAATTLGAPAGAELRLRPLSPDVLEVMLVLHGKPANRMPEAGFLSFTPAGASRWQFKKMGLWQAAGHIARRGGGGLQAVSAIRAEIGGHPYELVALDTPLVAPAETPFMRFHAEPPEFAAGLRFNLYNNKWGTNFAMWWSGELVARFHLRIFALDH